MLIGKGIGLQQWQQGHRLRNMLRESGVNRHGQIIVCDLPFIFIGVVPGEDSGCRESAVHKLAHLLFFCDVSELQDVWRIAESEGEENLPPNILLDPNLPIPEGFGYFDLRRVQIEIGPEEIVISCTDQTYFEPVPEPEEVEAIFTPA